MDSAGLTILLKELEVDCGVAQDAAGKARARIGENFPGRFEACAYELARFYSTFERMLERVCESFENHFEKRGDYHERLLQRATLDLEGIRPAFVPPDQLDGLREPKGFRHVVRHAYDITLREDRLAELSRLAADVSGKLPVWCEHFGRKIRVEQGW